MRLLARLAGLCVRHRCASPRELRAIAERAIAFAVLLHVCAGLHSFSSRAGSREGVLAARVFFSHPVRVATPPRRPRLPRPLAHIVAARMFAAYLTKMHAMSAAPLATQSECVQRAEEGRLCAVEAAPTFESSVLGAVPDTLASCPLSDRFLATGVAASVGAAFLLWAGMTKTREWHAARRRSTSQRWLHVPCRSTSPRCLSLPPLHHPVNPRGRKG